MLARGRGSASCLQRPSWRGPRCWASQERSWGHTASSSHSTSPSPSPHVSRGHVSSAHVSLLSSVLTVRRRDSSSGRWGGMVTTGCYLAMHGCRQDTAPLSVSSSVCTCCHGLLWSHVIHNYSLEIFRHACVRVGEVQFIE